MSNIFEIPVKSKVQSISIHVLWIIVLLTLQTHCPLGPPPLKPPLLFIALAKLKYTMGLRGFDLEAIILLIKVSQVIMQE